MLQQARQLAAADRLRNLTMLRGNATDLPWIDDQFDLVVCRLTLHQVDDPAAVVAEMVRVTKPGGRVAITDMIADPAPDIAEETNRLERLRDPSHGRTLSAAEIRQLVEQTGATVETSEVQDQPLDLEDWMARTETPDQTRTEIRVRLDDEIDGGRPTGLVPTRNADGTITFVHPWLTIVGRVEPPATPN